MSPSVCQPLHANSFLPLVVYVIYMFVPIRERRNRKLMQTPNVGIVTSNITLNLGLLFSL